LGVKRKQCRKPAEFALKAALPLTQSTAFGLRDDVHSG
jgi:hypothetical protein